MIIKRIPWFGHSELCFEMHASLISLLLCGTNKTLRAIDLLFVSNLSQSLAYERVFLFFCTYWFVKRWICFIFCVFVLIYSWFSATVIPYCKQFFSVLFGLFVTSSFLSHLGESMYDPSSLRLSYCLCHI